jgi:hypothetical protein
MLQKQCSFGFLKGNIMILIGKLRNILERGVKEDNFLENSILLWFEVWL